MGTQDARHKVLVKGFVTLSTRLCGQFPLAKYVDIDR